MQIKQLDVSPNPVIISEAVTVDANVQVNADLASPLGLSLTLEKKVGIWVEVSNASLPLYSKCK